jgi:hypothetical protein
MEKPSAGELRFIDRIYEQALRYGFADAKLIDARRAQLVKDFPAAFAGSDPAKVKKP